MAMSADSKTLVSAGGDDRYIKVWDLDEGKEKCTGHISNHLHQDKVVTVAITRDGKRAASGALDNKIRFFDLTRDKKEDDRQINFGGDVWSIAFSQDEKSIFAGGER